MRHKSARFFTLVMLGSLSAIGCHERSDATSAPLVVAKAPIARSPASVAVHTAAVRATAKPKQASTTEVGPKAGAQFLEEAQFIYRVAGCGGDRVQRDEVISDHCVALSAKFDAYKAQWLGKARPFFTALVPKDVPKTVVYPFGGVDLLTALTVFPNASEYTTLSLEPSGDPRLFRKLQGHSLATALVEIRTMLGRLLKVSHSRTIDLSSVTKRMIPGQLVFTLLALSVHGFEPLSVRYFTIDPDGHLIYVEESDFVGKRDHAALRKVFANVEVEFRSGHQLVVFRHIQANLSDTHLAGDRRILAHLERKGSVAAITKAASYLISSTGFRSLREYMLQNMVWMVSDSSGIVPELAGPAGFEQKTWGTYQGSFLAIGRPFNRSLISLWRRNGHKPLKFWFGYPDRNRNGHLMVTRRRSSDTVANAVNTAL